MEFLSHITLVDYIFPLDFQGKFGGKVSIVFYNNLYKTINPLLVISSTKADKHAESKKEVASGLNIGFLPFNELFEISTTTIERIFSEH